MRFLALVVLALALSCTRNPPEIQAQIDKLISQEKTIKQELNGLKYERNNLQQIVDSLKVLKEEVRALEYQKNGGEVEYILTVTLSQDRASMTGSSMKDYFNEVDFDIIVDRKTYNHYKKGMEYFRHGRKGSAMTEGSYSDWLIKVKDKKINYL